MSYTFSYFWVSKQPGALGSFEFEEGSLKPFVFFHFHPKNPLAVAKLLFSSARPRIVLWRPSFIVRPTLATPCPRRGESFREPLVGRGGLAVVFGWVWVWLGLVGFGCLSIPLLKKNHYKQKLVEHQQERLTPPTRTPLLWTGWVCGPVTQKNWLKKKPLGDQ